MTPWLHRFAVLTAAATFGLIGVGGLVTSHGVGMAVPDWPNTYGYNMFFFPVSKWVGGIFYEHSHRLLASGVGLLTTLLALWFYGRTARPFLRGAGLVFLACGLGLGLGSARHWADGVVLGTVGLAALCLSFIWPRSEPSAKWLRRLGIIAFFAVVLQGVLGGLRVVLFKDQIGIFHATLAQLFFVLTCALALFTSPWWQRSASAARWSRGGPPALSVGLVRLLIVTSTLILTQLILGATMRHQHAGLAIPDFPLAYGKLWPALDPTAVSQYNAHRFEILSVNPITAVQILLQMVHRLFALLILGGVVWSAWRARGELGSKDFLARFTMVWLSLVLIQVLLGAATIWSNKAADIATLHVLVGALSLASGGLVSIVACRRRRALADAKSVEAVFPGTSVPFGTRPSPVAGLD